MVIDRVADAVDGGDSANNQNIAAFEQAFGRRQAHLLDVLVDRRILFDKQVTLRDVGLRLVVVVVRNEILHRIFGEKFAELRIQLRRQGLVGCQHQGRATLARNDICHGVGLARAGDAKQRLKHQAVVDPFAQQANGFRLIAGGGKGLVQSPRRAGVFDHTGCRVAVKLNNVCHVRCVVGL